MTLKKIIFQVIALILIASRAFSTETACIYTIDNKPMELSAMAEYMEDTEGIKTLNDIRSLAPQYFIPLSNFHQQRASSVFWVKISLCNYSNNNRFVLNLADWLSGDTIDAYIFKKDSLISTSKSGYFRKAHELDYTFSNAVSKMGIYIPRGDTVSVYLRYVTHTGFGSIPKISLEHESVVLQHIRHRGLIQGIFQGLIWLIAILALSFFIFLRERIYLYYFLYIATFSIYFLGQDGFLFELILPNQPAIANILYAVSSIIGSAFFLLFTRELILNKNNLDFWKKGHLVLAILFLSLTLMVFISLVFHNIKIAFLLVNFGILLSTLYLIPYIIALSKSKNYEIRYVLFATLTLMFFSTLGIISLQFNIHFGNFSAYQLMKIGITLELIFFNIAIAYRLYANEMERHAARESLLEQMKINQSIKDKMNAELEDLVKLRTEELENQKAEMMAQRDDIYSKSQLLSDKNNEITIQKETIEQTHKLLTDSLNYARLIQNAIIPPPNLFQKTFDDFFLLSQPKDVVSGDFYWVKHQENKLLIAISDCTGHGVPGAMLSILGVTGLEKITHQSLDLNPATILNVMRDEIIKSLHQEDDLIAKEGMDMALCLIDNSTHKLIFSGAHQPGLIIRKGKLIKLKSSPQPIGRYLKETPFEQHSMELMHNDMIYLFTDGFFDQLGGEYTKKFMSGRFKEILLEIHELPCKEQMSFLKQSFKSWKGTNEQTDDVTVLGIRYTKS